MSAAVVVDAGTTAAEVTRAFVAALTALVVQIKVLDKRIAAQLAEHADTHIFRSLPRAATLRAARLIAEIGDCRGRFPTPEALAPWPGSPLDPAVREGPHHLVRWSADKQLRDAVCDCAAGFHHANPWAAHVYHQAITRGHRHPHAVRFLARAWLLVIRRCWQHHQPYQPAQHRARQLLLTVPPPQPGLGSSRGSPRQPGAGSARPPEGAGPPGPVLENPSTGTPPAG